jgi:hypothetical protein
MSPIAIALLLLAVCLIFFALNPRSVDGIDRDLLMAAKGNKALAKPLLTNARDLYPGKSDRWYTEKVLYDLQRDGAGNYRRSNPLRMNKRELRENIFLVGSVIWLINSIASLFRGRY